MTATDPMSAIDRRRLIIEESRSMNVTLDGLPARLSGAASQYASVARLDGKGGNVEYAWITAERILREKKGDFRS